MPGLAVYWVYWVYWVFWVFWVVVFWVVVYSGPVLMGHGTVGEKDWSNAFKNGDFLGGQLLMRSSKIQLEFVKVEWRMGGSLVVVPLLESLDGKLVRADFLDNVSGLCRET